MRTRILTMIALWIIIGLALGLGGIPGGQVLLLLLAVGVLSELLKLLKKKSISLAACLIAIVLTLAGHFWGFASLGTSVALILILAAHWKANPLILCLALGSVMLVALGLGSLNAIAHLPSPMALWWTVWLIATVKFSDAGAYLFGRHFGRHPLAPKISPGKTIEGLLGALFSGLILGILGAPLFFNPWLGPILGPILAFCGSVGDLAESALKRHAKVKDSGHILPGIGGLLDLTDSLLIAAPVGLVVMSLFAGQ